MAAREKEGGAKGAGTTSEEVKVEVVGAVTPGATCGP